MKIFVSYTIRDSYISHKYLSGISDALSDISEPYIDILHNKGEDKQSFVESKLLSSNIVLQLRSESFHLSHWANWEIQRANNNRIPIISIHIHRDSLDESLSQIRSSFFKQKLTSQARSTPYATALHINRN